MKDSNVYEAPKCIDLDRNESRRRSIKWLMIFAVLLISINIFLEFYITDLNISDTNQMIGMIVAIPIVIILIPLAFCLPFQVFKRFRNKYSRLKIFNWWAFLLLVITITEVYDYTTV